MFAPVFPSAICPLRIICSIPAVAGVICRAGPVATPPAVDIHIRHRLTKRLDSPIINCTINHFPQGGLAMRSISAKMVALVSLILTTADCRRCHVMCVQIYKSALRSAVRDLLRQRRLSSRLRSPLGSDTRDATGRHPAKERRQHRDSRNQGCSHAFAQSAR
jgi:hypothetical protein